MQLPTKYTVYHSENGELLKALSTDNKTEAVYEVKKLRSSGKKQAHIQLGFKTGGKLRKKKYKVRFHLGKGKNFGKWKVENTETGTDKFYDPDQVQLKLTNCKLTNNPKTAEKIYAGDQNKAPIAYFCS